MAKTKTFDPEVIKRYDNYTPELFMADLLAAREAQKSHKATEALVRELFLARSKINKSTRATNQDRVISVEGRKDVKATIKYVDQMRFNRKAFETDNPGIDLAPYFTPIEMIQIKFGDDED